MRSRRGASFALLSMVGTDRFDIAVSVPLILEYEEVLTRQAGRDVAVVNNLLDFICEVAERRTIFFLWRPCLPDPEDDMVLELAIAAGCEAIVTYNRRDFEPISSGYGIRVQSPAEFLRQLGEFS